MLNKKQKELIKKLEALNERLDWYGFDFGLVQVDGLVTLEQAKLIVEYYESLEEGDDD